MAKKKKKRKISKDIANILVNKIRGRGRNRRMGRRGRLKWKR